MSQSQKNFKAIRILVACLNVCIVPVAQGAVKKNPKMALIKPVKVLGVSRARTDGPSRKVLASYQLACGETFRGVLVRDKRTATDGMSGQVARQKKLVPKAKAAAELAVVVDREEAFCSSLPQTVEFSIPVREGSNFSSMKIREPRRITLGEALDISNSPYGFIIGWQNSCRTTLGVILKPILEQNNPKIEISMAHAANDQSPNGSSGGCAREVKTVRLSALDIPAESMVLAERPGQIENSYVMKLAEVKSIKIGADGQLTVGWQKGCREKILGLLFTGPAGRNLAILSAVVPSQSCRGPKTMQDFYTLRGLLAQGPAPLHPVRSTDLADIARQANFNYQVLPVASMETARSQSGDSINIISKRLNCGDLVGVLAGNDSYGNLSMGVLAASSGEVCTVRHPNAVKRLQVPLAGPETGPLPKAFGLRVFGNALN